MTTLVRGNVYVYHCVWINPPHDKIAICICNVRNWFLWFNTNAAFHGLGQLAIVQADHPSAITRNCFLDLSAVKGSSPQELIDAAKNDRGPISAPLKEKIRLVLQTPIPLLPDLHRSVILECL